MDHQSHEPARFWYYYDFSPLQPGRYYCGDCFQLLPAIESGTVDMVLIDPPYYMGKDKAWDCFEGRADYMAFMGRAFIQAAHSQRKWNAGLLAQRPTEDHVAL